MSAITRQLLIEEEGVVNHAYTDSLGFTTIGVGHLIDPRKGGKISDAIVAAILDEDIAAKTADAATLDGFAALNDVQRAAVVAMVFQLGIGGVRGFPAMLRALAAGDFKSAAAAGRASLWHQQTPARSNREMKMLETGLWVPKGTT